MPVFFVTNIGYDWPMSREKSPSVADHDIKVSGPEGVRQLRWGLAAEVPVSLCYNGVAHVVMMASPSDLEDFAVGFSLSERILESVADIEALDVREVDRGTLVDLRVSEAANARVSARRRNLPGQASCGICGVIELEAALPDLPKVAARPTASLAAVKSAVASLREHQPLNAQTRSLHGAAFADQSGAIVLTREDIGRHNALDKLIGAAARQDISLEEGFALLSSRCSVELVQKAVIAGIPLMVTVSAPTTLAVELAEEAGLTLFCMAGDSSVAIITDPHSIYSRQKTEASL